jgi:hypothetical protein
MRFRHAGVTCRWPQTVSSSASRSIASPARDSSTISTAWAFGSTPIIWSPRRTPIGRVRDLDIVEAIDLFLLAIHFLHVWPTR